MQQAAVHLSSLTDLSQMHHGRSAGMPLKALRFYHSEVIPQSDDQDQTHFITRKFPEAAAKRDQNHMQTQSCATLWTQPVTRNLTSSCLSLVISLMFTHPATTSYNSACVQLHLGLGMLDLQEPHVLLRHFSIPQLFRSLVGSSRIKPLSTHQHPHL